MTRAIAAPLPRHSPDTPLLFTMIRSVFSCKRWLCANRWFGYPQGVGTAVCARACALAYLRLLWMDLAAVVILCMCCSVVAGGTAVSA